MKTELFLSSVSEICIGPQLHFGIGMGQRYFRLRDAPAVTAL